MATRAEQWVAASLRTALAALPVGASIPESEEFRKTLCGLERYIAEVLREVYPEWQHEGLDGVLPLTACKTGDAEADIFGLCIIISDQTTTPIHVRLRASLSGDTVSWIECELGERSEQGMVRVKWQSTGATNKRLRALAGRADGIDWVYRVTRGQRRPWLADSAGEGAGGTTAR